MYMVDLFYVVDFVEKVFFNLVSWFFFELFYSDCDNIIGIDLVWIGFDVFFENSFIFIFFDFGLEVSSNKFNFCICELNNCVFGC